MELCYVGSNVGLGFPFFFRLWFWRIHDGDSGGVCAEVDGWNDVGVVWVGCGIKGLGVRDGTDLGWEMELEDGRDTRLGQDKSIALKVQCRM